MSKRIAIIDGLRTPFCKAGGPLGGVQADDLAVGVTRELMARAGVDGEQIDEVIFGNVCQPAHAANIARVIALKAGLPERVICHTVNRNCASGMQAVTSAAAQILTGQADLVLAGGTESMSNVPLLYGRKMTKVFTNLARAKTAGAKLQSLASVRPSYLSPVIALKLGLTDPVCGLNMGQTAEVLAREFKITRDEQDEFALASHQKACAAAEAGALQDELHPVASGDYTRVQETDDGPRQGQSIEALKKLRPVFDREAGTVTVGNACPITDGAAVVLMASEQKAREFGVQPLGWLTGWAYAGLGGDRMGLGPVYATARLLDREGMSMSDFDYVELNEAFAVQVIANERAFGSESFARKHLGRDRAVGELDRERLNLGGGAIALGHPVGATGTRLAITLLKQLRRDGRKRGLATLCIGGGQGAALSLEAA